MNFLSVHLGLILTGFAGIAVSVGGALLYLAQSAQLKSHHPGRLFLALPSLDRLDRLHFRALSFGLIVFSVGLLVGAFHVHGLSGYDRALKDPTVILSVLACVLYWVLLTVRASELRRGQKIAVGTLLVFLLLLATLITSYAVPAGLHGGA